MDSTFFAGNRERLRTLFTGTAPIIITGNGLLQKSADEPFPFQQDTSFWYLTGIDEPEVLLVMDKGREYLIVPPRESTRETFDGRIDPDYLTRISGIRTVYTQKEGWKHLEARIRKVQNVATLGAAAPYIEHYGFYANPARAALIKRLKEHNPEVELLDLRQHLARMRMIKQPAEIAALQQAIDITIDTLKDVTRPSKLPKYAHEYEVEADITRGFRRRGAEGNAFASIVAGGARACTLHNVANNAPLASDELLVLDVGARYNHYCADITRTISLSTPSRRQEQVHAAVNEAVEYALGLLKPGAIRKDYEEAVEQFVGEKLRELGLIKSIDHDAVRTYFPHATSHFLGIDTHDVGDYERPLEAGMVMTVEPGIYIREEGIGVRIEEDVLITPEGVDVLSARLPRSPA